MRRATITLTDELEVAVDAFVQDQSAPPTLTAIAQSALREYLEVRGYLPSRKVLRITPVEEDSGDPGASIEHDRYVAEMHE